MASLASTLSLQNYIRLTRLVSDPEEGACDRPLLPHGSVSHVYQYRRQNSKIYVQKVWDRSIVDNRLAGISSKLSSEVDKVCNLSASSHHSGDRVIVTPINQFDRGWAMKRYGLLLASDWDCALVTHTLVYVEKKWSPEVTRFITPMKYRSTATPCRL